MNDTTRHIDPAVSLLKAIDRIQEIGECWVALTDLLIPESDLHGVGRHEFASLIRILSNPTPAGSEAHSAEGRLEELRSCLSGLFGLLLPEDDLCQVDRDKLATLAYRIVEEQRQALAVLEVAANREYREGRP